MDSEKKKRERNVNYTFEETEKLIFLVEQRINVIECKKCDSETWQVKDKAWKEIEQEFNKDPRGVYRNAKQLKFKYESLKKNSKRSSRPPVQNDNKITPVVLEEIHKKVREIISLPVDGDDGLNVTDRLDHLKCELQDSYFSNDDNTQDDDSLHAPNSLDDKSKLRDSIYFVEVPPPVIELEPVAKKRCLDADSELLSSQVKVDITRTSDDAGPDEDHQWTPAQLLAKDDHSFNKPNECVPEKLDVETLQRRILEEEMKQKIIQTKILQEELIHKRQLQDLQKQQLLLRISILKKALER